VFSNKPSNHGQVILIILLVTTVGLTIGLSLVSRTIQDLKVSSQIAESSKAFSAAESGIEAALKGNQVGVPGNVAFTGGANARYTISTYGNNSTPFTLSNVAAGDAKTVWFVDHQIDGSLLPYPNQTYNPPGHDIDICWGPTAGQPDPNPAAIEFTVLHHNGSSTYNISKVTADPGTPWVSSNHFNTAGIDLNDATKCQNSNKKYHINLNFTNNGPTDFNVGGDKVVLLRINAVYNPTDIVVSPKAQLPAQGKQITSTGTTTSGVARKLNVLEGYQSLPAVFDYTLFVNQ